MEFSSKLLSASRQPLSEIDADFHSDILAGNLASCEIQSSSVEGDEELCHEDDEETIDVNEMGEIALEDLKKVDEIIKDQLGIPDVLSNFIKLLLSEKMLPTEILVQALAYKVHSSIKGKHSIRYKDSYGMYWAGVRNILKQRGLVVFQEHFPIPTDLTKMKKKIIETCDLETSSLGKSGLQKKNVELWINEKKKEADGSGLGISVSIDGKKISASSEGMEDLGGLGGADTVSDELKQHEENKQSMFALLNSVDTDRQACYMLYDKLTQETAKLVSKLDAINSLIVKNSKAAEKNTNLCKYVFVLNQQKDIGKRLLGDVQNIQKEIISRISHKRNSDDFLPDSASNLVDLGAQQNYYRLSKSDDLEAVRRIETVMAKANNILELPWDAITAITTSYSRLLSRIDKDSELFKNLFRLCYLPDDHVFKACGLSKHRPLADMKQAYLHAHSKVGTYEPPQKPDVAIVASLCAQFASMSFGRNMVLRDAGIFIKDGVCTSPDLVVLTKPNSECIEFSVKIYEVAEQTFKFTEEMLIASLVSSSIANASRGCLLVLYSTLSCVVFDVPRNDTVVDKILHFTDSFLKESKCLSKRTKEMMEKMSSVQNVICNMAKDIVTLGSYPLVGEVRESLHTATIEEDILKPILKRKVIRNVTEIAKVQHNLQAFLDSTKKFLSKQAKELICVNISDLSGSSSRLPHTLLAATYLTGSSLKTIVKDCLSATTDFLEKKDVHVLNYAFDGESLHLATTLDDGTPGTDLALAKAISKKLNSFTKNELINLVAENVNIKLDGEGLEAIEEDEEQNVIHGNVEEFVNESIVLTNQQFNHDPFSLEDVESLLKVPKLRNRLDFNRRHEICSAMKIFELRSACLKEVFPEIKKKWIIQNYGSEKISIQIQNQATPYSPSTVFEKNRNGCFRTVTFDPAHISNLLRESCAKGKLVELGLGVESLKKLSESSDFAYIRKILSLKNGSLEFDPMNQISSATLFSSKTEMGLRLQGDTDGSKCIKILREGVIESMDTSGIASQDRCRMVLALKSFLDEKIDVLKKMRRPGQGEITAELFQMQGFT